MTAEEQFNKMTKTPIHKLILGLSAPTIISMLVSNIYNTADTYFVSTISTSASGAIGIVFSLMAIQQAFGFMFGHGAGTNIARMLGRKKTQEAKVYASTSFYLSFFIGLVIMILGFIFMEPFLYILGSTKTILPYAKVYATFILIAGPFLTSSCVMNNILRYEGQAFYAMFGLTAGGILNMIGDPILMFGFHMGVEGAGLSTLLSQIISFFILFYMFISGKTQSKFNISYFTHNIYDIGKIISNGFPSLTRQGLNSLSIMILNNQAGLYGDAAIAAMSIVNRITMLVFSIGVGFGQGFQPVSAFNFGAKKYSRVKSAFKFICILTTIVLGIVAMVFYFFSGDIIQWFRNDTSVISVGTVALQIASFTIVFGAIASTSNMLFQSIGKSGMATFLASTRSGLFFIPLIIILPNYFGLFGIQISQPISDFLSFVISLPVAYIFLKSLPPDGENV